LLSTEERKFVYEVVVMAVICRKPRPYAVFVVTGRVHDDWTFTGIP